MQSRLEAAGAGYGETAVPGPVRARLDVAEYSTVMITVACIVGLLPDVFGDQVDEVLTPPLNSAASEPSSACPCQAKQAQLSVDENGGNPMPVSDFTPLHQKREQVTQLLACENVEESLRHERLGRFSVEENLIVLDDELLTIAAQIRFGATTLPPW